MNCRVLARADDIPVGNRVIPQSEVVAYRTFEQENILCNASERIDEYIRGNLVPWNTVKRDFSGPGLIFPTDDLRNRALPGAAPADQRNSLAGPYRQIEILDQRFFQKIVTKRGVPQFDMALQMYQWDSACARHSALGTRGLDFMLQDVINSVEISLQFLER